MNLKFPFISFLIAAALALSAVAAQAAPAPAPVIKAPAGEVRGTVQNGMNAYRGIPYAKPPVGALRWQPPQPAEPWSGVRDALNDAPQCAQNADLGVFSKAGGQEDCLYLNVYVNKDALATGEKLPVFVWIFGGGLRVGSGNDYNPERLVRQGRGIVVTFNYRVGVLGFLAHPALNAEKSRHTNYGFMDQALALDWVQKNIAYFGGDPNNVTIAGESAGAHSVFSHIVSPYSAGKFQYAVAMSGGNVSARQFSNPVSLADALKSGEGFARAVSCDTAECLRALPLATILKEQTPFATPRPIINGDFLPISYADAFQAGKVNRVTLINGNMLDEGTFFAGTAEQLSGKPIDQAAYEKMIRNRFGDVADRVLQEYPVNRYANPAEAYAAHFTDSVFACPAHQTNAQLARFMPVYAYEFADRTAPSYLPPVSIATNAAHTYELPYLFPGFKGGSNADTSLNAQQTQLANDMAAIWTNIKQLNRLRPDWAPYDAQQQNVMNFTLPQSAMKSGTFRQMHHCDFWERLGLYQTPVIAQHSRFK